VHPLGGEPHRVAFRHATLLSLLNSVNPPGGAPRWNCSGTGATGDPVVGICDDNQAPPKYALTYRDCRFDTTGPEVHAEGKI